MYLSIYIKFYDICTKIVFINSKRSFLQPINTERKEQELQHQDGKICITAAAQQLYLYQTSAASTSYYKGAWEQALKSAFISY